MSSQFSIIWKHSTDQDKTMENTSADQFNKKKDALTLENIFKNIINTDQEIETSVDQMKTLIENDLNLKLDKLDEDQIATLPYMLLRYIRNWPGWSRKTEYDNGSLNFKSWSLRFRNYIYYKMQLLVTKTLPSLEADDASSTNTEKFVEAGTQSESTGNFANFSIDVSGPAILLNNLVFSGHKDSIRVEQHAEKPWIELNCAELLNYPYVEVEFNGPELSFKRSFEPKASLFVSSTSDFIVEESNFILGKSSINSKCSKWPIKLTILETYIQAFKSAVFSHFQYFSNQQEELNAVLDQFYEDMVDISFKKGVYENRRTTFNIGRCHYKRNKKITHGTSASDVLFNEMYLPRVITSFRYFTGMQHDMRKRIAADPEKINQKTMLQFKPRITYKCTYCKIAFNGSEALSNLVEHLKVLHRRAQTLVCVKCNKCIEVAELSRRRWKCVCVEES